MTAATTDFTQWEKKIPRQPLTDRDAYILAACAGRDVIHLGACDYPMTRGKAEKGELLHQKMQGKCRSLVGYDNDGASIGLLRDEFGLSDIVDRDLSKPFDESVARGDLVVCADIIEHVNNVGNLLEACNRLLRPGGTLLVSTINAASLKQAIRALSSREPVHPDHVAYFSYATLGVLMSRFGFRLEDCRYFAYPTLSGLAQKFFDAVHRCAPPSADGIIVAAHKERDV
jgi:SAM-dependent methyltransferase